MAFDPIQEDCLRLTLSNIQRGGINPLIDPQSVQRLVEQYQADPEQLIANDAERSFHLVALACGIIDYRVPFLTDPAEAESQATLAEQHLREAVELDPGNWDARRMLAAMESSSNDAYVTYLLEHTSEVESTLPKENAEQAASYEDGLALTLEARPYLRWLSALASRQLIAGQYSAALKTARDCLAIDPYDAGDIRHTGVYALAKLERPAQELDQLIASPLETRRTDPWGLIARMSLAYRDFDYAVAGDCLRKLLHTYPHGAESLMYQAEFPDGVFSRVNVEPGSDDELVLALSEATPLLQEGAGTPDAACFSTWVATHELVRQAIQSQQKRPRGRGRAVRKNGGA